MIGDWVTRLVASGRIADIAMAVIFIEALVIGVVFRRRPLAALSLTLASGFALLGALRAALTGATAGLVALWLLAALAAHASDIVSRLRKPRLTP